MEQIFRIERNGDARFHLVGELDMSTAADLEAALDDARRSGELTLDLTGLTFIDSSGIQVLLRFVTSRNGDASEGALVLEGAAPNVRRALEIVGIDRIEGVRLVER